MGLGITKGRVFSILQQGGWLLMTVLAVLLVFAANPSRAADLLEPNAAFKLSAISEAGQVRLHWDIAEGHYLYRSRVHVELPQVEGLSFSPLVLPDGEEKTDEFLGMIQVYHHDLDVRLPYTGVVKPTDLVPVTVTYQGCAERGVCYPPQTKTLHVKLTPGTSSTQANTDLIGSTSGTSEQTRLFGILAGGNTAWIALVFAGLGLLLAFTPCVLPMIPILSSLVVGTGERTGPWRGLGLSAAYVFSMAAAYSVLGMVAGRFGQNLQAWMQSPWIIGAFSAMFIVFAFAMFGLFDMQLSGSLQTRLTKVVNRLPGGRFTSAAVMGFMSALIVGPCVTPPLAGALLYIGQTGDMLTGGLALFALGLGMGIPLLLVGVLGGSVLPKAGGWMEAVRAAFGFVLLGVAIWMLSRIVPEPITVGLWGALLLGLGVSLGGFEPQSNASSGMRLRKYSGVLAAVYGILLLVGSAAGTHSALAPLAILVQRSGTSEAETLTPAFRPLKSLEQLRATVSAAAGRPVVVDFYADWCVSCKQMERNVFTDPRVAAELQRAILLRPDVTSNDEQARALMQSLDVVGPPTMLFYGPDGRERRALRLVGEAGVEVVLDHLHQAFGTVL
jgi:thiol:disulfide interchange protein DsbD